VSASDDAVWTVGDAFRVAKGDFDVLVMRGDENEFRRVNAPNPSAGVDILSSVAAARNTVWSVGHFSHGPRFPLIEEHAGADPD